MFIFQPGLYSSAWLVLISIFWLFAEVLSSFTFFSISVSIFMAITLISLSVALLISVLFTFLPVTLFFHLVYIFFFPLILSNSFYLFLCIGRVVMSPGLESGRYPTVPFVQYALVTRTRNSRSVSMWALCIL